MCETITDAGVGSLSELWWLGRVPGRLVVVLALLFPFLRAVVVLQRQLRQQREILLFISE